MKSDSLYYIHKDYQGNIESITSEQGQLLETISFDPWGRRRNANTWEYDVNIKPQHFDRGYTMHEHLDVFGLINMNGRVYDPWVGRMLSPDPFIQDPTNTQNYNRYSYALNNPLKYTDPSGYHHNSVFKPGDWNAGISSGGALYINNWFTNDFNHNPFGNYEQSHTYSYDNFTGTWSNGAGQQVSPLEVHANKTWSHEEFNNFVEENSVTLPSNTDLNSIEKKDGGYQYFTVDPSSSLWNSSPNEFNLHFVFLGNSIGSGGGVNGDNPGHVISVANGAAAYGFGAMVDVGAVVDSYGNSKMYLTLGVTIGWGASAGMGYSSTNKKMSMSDFSGWAAGINATIPFTPLSVEGYKDMSHGAVRDYYGNNLNGYGGNIGIGKGWFGYFSYTITFDPPSSDFWLHPATHR